MIPKADVHFDFRAKLVVAVLVMSLVALLTSDITLYALMVFLVLYLAIQGLSRHALIYALIALALGMMRVVSNGNGLTFLLPEMFLFILVRTTIMLMAAEPLLGMPPGEVVAVCKKMRVPDMAALPLTFMLRFLPAVEGEFRDVFEALGMRRLLSFRHPLRTFEHVVTPVMLRSSRIAEELAASAESRGISSPGEHTCRRAIRFGCHDAALSIISMAIAFSCVVFDKGFPA